MFHGAECELTAPQGGGRVIKRTGIFTHGEPGRPIVIGVVADGVARAFRLQVLLYEGNPGEHIVNDLLGSVPVTFAHCNNKDCTQVFAGEKGTTPLDVRAGGMTSESELVLLLNGNRYHDWF